jgi:hypothetical protein
LSFPKNPDLPFLRTKSEVFNDQGSTGFVLAPWAEEGAHVLGQQFWFLQSREMSTSWHLGPALDS